MSKIATREAYGKQLAKLVETNKNIVVLDADLTKSTKTVEAKKVCPERHFNMGIAEGNMMSVASGLAASGKVVFASSFSIFATGRAFEQIRNSICYPNLNVKICGTHAGITVGEDGASHQGLEDIAIMRSIPNMRVIQPCDGKEAEEVIKCVSELDGPVYVRLGRSAVETIHDDNYHFTLGKGELLHQGTDVAIIATGCMVQESLIALELLKQKGMNPTLVNMASIKPIDEELLIKLANTHHTIVTVEEHNVIGGLGGAVCEVLAQNHPIKVVRLGMQDSFGESGTPSALLAKYQLDGAGIATKVEEIYGK